jgi:hypothetical protein
MTDQLQPLTEEELAHWAKFWQATVYRNRGPDFVAQRPLSLSLRSSPRYHRSASVQGPDSSPASSGRR